jgi:hypothetical protein
MLYWAFNKLKSSQWLQGINLFYGSLPDVSLMSSPSVVMIPTNDTYGDPDGPRLQEQVVITNGVESYVHEFNRRGAGASLHLYVTGGPEDVYQSLETLINDVANALRETPGNYNNQNITLLSGQYLDRTQLSENTVGYALQIVTYVPLYYLTPIYQPTSFSNVIPTPNI